MMTCRPEVVSGRRPPVNYPSSQKVVHFYFGDNFGNSGPILIIFTVKFRKDMWRKLELKLPPPLKPVAALPCEM